ncbi:thaumatin-like protein 1b [Ananas comosus]|uniref:Thaumatin-like protein 1b n=1 Tax=Ananas comosus TaxID=4615 RepID=A0A6P5EN50_ANACO|nr:thaumatin-like protein 1b [Ananas comosus]
MAKLLYIVAACVSGANSIRRYFIDNECPGDSLWLGSVPAIGLLDFELPTGTLTIINADDHWRGRFYFRMHCAAHDRSGGFANFTCLTGDCRSNVMSCEGRDPVPPATAVVFEYQTNTGNIDPNNYSYYVDLVHGFNVPAVVAPLSGGQGQCQLAGCPADINKSCPTELQLQVKDASGATIGCNSTCDATQDPAACCEGQFAGRDACRPSAQANLFKGACPLAHTWKYDDDRAIYSCAGADFNITLCPSS